MGANIDKTKDTSPSSRRAWIEISRCSAIQSASTVALLAEGVDRNIAVFQTGRGEGSRVCGVALLAEGVDRNTGFFFILSESTARRPPRGGRG